MLGVFEKLMRAVNVLSINNEHDLFSERTYDVVGPKAWNRLPVDIKSTRDTVGPTVQETAENVSSPCCMPRRGLHVTYSASRRNARGVHPFEAMIHFPCFRFPLFPKN